MKTHLTTLVFLSALTGSATNFYVSPTGSNVNNGLSQAAPFGTLQYASQQAFPGDTVFAMNGTYTNSQPGTAVMTVWRSGTANAWITYRNLPGHTPVIQLTSNWVGIGVDGEDYIIIDGFTIIGNNANITQAYALSEQNNTNNPATSGNGIGIAQQFGNPTERSHHVIVRNCTIRDCGGGGIYTYQADHISILNNTVLNCGWYAPYGNSGISNFQNWNSDGGTGIKMRIEGNLCAGNFNYVPFIAAGSITDGNGIILDDSRNTQNGSTLGVYPGGTYVANNVCFANGGRGIHAFYADHITVVNNTTYHNCLSPAIDDGEFTAYYVSDMTFRNNIAMPEAGTPPMDQFNTTALTVDHNLWGANSGLADPFGTSTLVGDPLFVAPSEDPTLANFQVAAGSPAIDTGSDTGAPLADLLGTARPTGGVDIGAYEFLISTTVSEVVDPFAWQVLQDPAGALVLVALPEDAMTRGAELRVLDTSGRMVARERVSSTRIWLDASGWNAGIYVVELITATGSQGTHSVVR